MGYPGGVGTWFMVRGSKKLPGMGGEMDFQEKPMSPCKGKTEEVPSHGYPTECTLLLKHDTKEQEIATT